MTRKEIASLALKFFAMYLFANILFALPSALLTQTMIWNMLERAGEAPTAHIVAWLVGGGILLIGVIVAIIIWRISNSFIQTSEIETTKKSSTLTADLQQIIIIAIGLFFLVEAIPSSGYFAASIINFSTDEFDTVIMSNLIATFIQLLVALSLIFFPNWWGKIFRMNKVSE